VLFPGTGFLELVLAAGREVGCGVVRELVLEAPLVLSADEDVRLQVLVGDAGEDGERSVSVFSHVDGVQSGLDGGDGDGWTRHASGVLSLEDDLDSGVGFGGMWPPEGASEVPVDEVYGRLADMGLDYGPAFQGLRGVWRDGDELFCEVSLSEDQLTRSGSYGVHPALLDAALHASVLLASGDQNASNGGPRLPFSWNDVCIGALGSSSSRVRLMSTTGGADNGEQTGSAGVLSLVAFDGEGSLVVSVGSLVSREVSLEELRASGGVRESLFGVGWSPVVVGSLLGGGSDVNSSPLPAVVGECVLLGGEGRVSRVLGDAGFGVRVFSDLGVLGDSLGSESLSEGSVVVLDLTGHEDDGGLSVERGVFEDGVCGQREGGGVLGGARSVVLGVLDVLRGWLVDERLAGARLVVLSSDAVRVGAEDRLGGLLSSGVWGLVRSAQSEHPDRFVLIDIDAQESSLSELPSVIALAAERQGEPQLAIRNAQTLIPRLTRLVASDQGESAEVTRAPDGVKADGRQGGQGNGLLGLNAGTVLITGGTGVLGANVARHLALEHDVRSLVLTSRRGIEAPGAEDLRRELNSIGVEAQIVACDVSDRDAVRGLLENVPAEFPLRGVVHAAGALEDGVIDSLTEERVDRVWAPKVSAAWHLHELTSDLDLSMFVLFSSAAAIIGSPGQGNYAAANAFLDSLAAYRCARGLAGTSIAWGLWAQTSELTSALAQSDLARMQRAGYLTLSTEQGLTLFDAACSVSYPSAVAVRFDGTGLRVSARNGTLPALLRGLARLPVGRAANTVDSLARRLAGIPDDQRENAILEIVRSEIATVLGHPSSNTIAPDRAFKDLGFDSLTAVELRNRLSALTSLRLPATVVFDYPNPTALAQHLYSEVGQHVAGAVLPVDAELDRLELALASVADDGAERARIAARLHTLTSQFDRTVKREDHARIAAEIHSASAEEIFELIDRDLQGR
jgi:NAD(P)-dependent dehydrogenase (short-subunit alcohol dehydrogenase family)/acyl carrier protein